MALAPYCSPDEVRAVLGPTDVELSNSTLDLPVYSLGLLRELRRISLTLPAAYLVANTAVAPTAQQQSLVDSVREFSVYCVARQVGASLGLTAAKDITDDKASLGRFSDGSFQDVLARVEELFQRTRAALVEVAAVALSDVGTSSFIFPIAFVPSRRGIDPVTGV